MKKIFIALYGLKATGKTYFCEYLHNKFNATIVYLSRILEEKYCSTPEGVKKYEELKIINKSRIPLINDIKNNIKNIIKNSSLIAIEGFLSLDDCLYFDSLFNSNCIKILIENTNNLLRLKRYCTRHNYDINEAKTQLKENDIFRKLAGNEIIKDLCNYRINNNSAFVDYELDIETVLKQIGVVNA